MTTTITINSALGRRDYRLADNAGVEWRGWITALNLRAASWIPTRASTSSNGKGVAAYLLRPIGGARMNATWHRIRHGHWPFYRPDILPEWAAGICVRCIKTVEIVEVQGAAGTGEGAEETLERLPAPEPWCNGLDTGCTATPDCPVHMGVLS